MYTRQRVWVDPPACGLRFFLAVFGRAELCTLSEWEELRDWAVYTETRVKAAAPAAAVDVCIGERGPYTSCYCVQLQLRVLVLVFRS